MVDWLFFIQPFIPFHFMIFTVKIFASSLGFQAMKHLEQAQHSVYALQCQVNVDNMYKILQLIQSL